MLPASHAPLLGKRPVYAANVVRGPGFKQGHTRSRICCPAPKNRGSWYALTHIGTSSAQNIGSVPQACQDRAQPILTTRTWLNAAYICHSDSHIAVAMVLYAGGVWRVAVSVASPSSR